MELIHALAVFSPDLGKAISELSLVGSAAANSVVSTSQEPANYMEARSVSASEERGTRMRKGGKDRGHMQGAWEARAGGVGPSLSGTGRAVRCSQHLWTLTNLSERLNNPQ